MTITLEWWQWVFPAIIAAAIVGLYRGWRIMGLWTVGVFFSGLASARIGPKLDLLLTKLFSVGGQFFAIATDKPETSVNTPQIQIASPWEPIATGIFFILLVVLSWWVARRLAGNGGSDLGLLGRLMGAAFGALAAILGLSQAFDYWTDFVSRSGSTSAGAAVTVPQISVGVAGLPSTNPLVGLATGAIALFLLLVIVYTIWRALRAT
jgi:hypothetical protein